MTLAANASPRCAPRACARANACHRAAYLEYNWNGHAIDMVFELSRVG